LESSLLELNERPSDSALVGAYKISEEYTGQLDDLRYRLAEVFEERRRKDLPDYDIFMAIAEEIGYDATGRETKTNELETIATE
jgi:type I restriction enzyme M protein